MTTTPLFPPGLTSGQPAPSAATPPPGIEWCDTARQAAFEAWLADQATQHGLLAATARPASADASFRRYFRVERADGGSCIVMDAPPDKENCQPFVTVAGLMAGVGLRIPDILAWDAPQGFMLLNDLGTQTLLDVLDLDNPQANQPRYMDALAALLPWQAGSREGVLPVYDEALLRRELQLFPDWYLGQHKQFVMSDAQTQVLNKAFNSIVTRNLAAPKVWVHRDFMPRNLMVPPNGFSPATAAQALGVLDFQDAVYGPITYDIASLMRDAFVSWEEDFVLEVTVRYWERARKVGLMDFEDWHSDFGSFWRAVEWMGLQRHLKVAGIFARLTLRDGKPKYLADAPRFIHYIRHTVRRYRELQPLMQLLEAVEPDADLASGFAFGRV